MNQVTFLTVRLEPAKSRALKALLAQRGLSAQRLFSNAVEELLAQQLPGDRSAPKPHAEVNDART